MIKIASREEYFNKDITDIQWHECHIKSYKNLKFINWVFDINGEVYPFCTAEFKKAFFWEQLKND